MLLQMAKFYSFFVAESFSIMCVCVCVCVCVCIHLWMCRHLGCFCILAVVNNTAVNIGVHVSFRISVFIFFRYTPKSGIAGSHSSSIFSFLGTSILFSTVAAPMYIPINSAQGFPFLYILVNICYLCSFR